MSSSRKSVKTGHLPLEQKAARIVIITGLSGSGKTVALRTVEDLHFFCVDNLPVSLIDSLISKISVNTGDRNIAIGVDIREKEFLANIDMQLSDLRKKHRVEILYLEAETDVLLRRFKETRRPHPLGGDLEEAIKAERKSLSTLKKNADRIIDTSSFTPHQLRRFIVSLYPAAGNHKDMALSLLSFGFKFGVPQNIDLLFDVRFLPNPNFIVSLKELTGIDKPVSEYVLKHKDTKELIDKIKDLIAFVLPLYIREGRSYLTIAVGCTGGRHRSPAIIEELSGFIDNGNIELKVTHRELT